MVRVGAIGFFGADDAVLIHFVHPGGGNVEERTHQLQVRRRGGGHDRMMSEPFQLNGDVYPKIRSAGKPRIFSAGMERINFVSGVATAWGRGVAAACRCPALS